MLRAGEARNPNYRNSNDPNVEKKRAQEHKIARHKGIYELVKWRVYRPDEYLAYFAYFTVDILDILSLRTKILRESVGGGIV